MKAFYMECMEQQAKDLRWVTLEELKQEIAIPSAFAPFKDLLNSGADDRALIKSRSRRFT